jgi:hypothetical protein
MKLAAGFTLSLGFSLALSFPLAMTASVSAYAQTEQCRFVQDKGQRDACYQRQDAARIVRQKEQAAREAEQSKPIEPMSGDDEQMARAIRGICRGC